MLEQKTYIFYGYHGTAESCAINISETGLFDPGRPRDDHWLGQGSYFFKEDEEQAIMWAKNKVRKHSKFKGEMPSVIEVLLQVGEFNFLNLDTRKGIELLLDFIAFLRDKGVKIEASVSDETSKKIRCYILSLLPRDIWMIQRTFETPSSMNTDATLNAMDIKLHGTQICVRNNEAILGNTIKVKKVLPTVQKKFSRRPRFIN